MNDYWTEYTGNANHGRMADRFSPIHETRLRINYTYYNSPDIFYKICEWYDVVDASDSFDFTIIDDGSQDVPITNLDIPDYWTVLVVTEDNGWNNEGARNCLMQHTNNRWNLVLDSDWVITRENLFKIRRNISYLPRDVLYLPGNFGATSIRNSYLITKEEFWNRGGYDQAFIGYHGNDYSFLRCGLDYDNSDWFSLTRLVDDVIDPNEKNRFEQVKKFHRHMEELEKLGFGYRNPEDKQDFTWTDEEAHKRHWKDIKFKQVK